MNTDFYDFKYFVDKTIEIVRLDLDALEKIAKDATPHYSPIQTTIRPGDESLIEEEYPKISRCSIPIAMVCFSVIDMFGQWVNANSESDFASSASSFFEQLANKEDLKNLDASEKFKKVFRNGIVHSFFSFQGFTVSYPSFENNNLFIDLIDKRSTLDVKYLMKIVRIGITNLETALLNEENKLSQDSFEGYKRWLEVQEKYQ